LATVETITHNKLSIEASLKKTVKNLGKAERDHF